MDYFFQLFYIDKISQFIAEKLNIFWALDFLNYIIAILFILAFYFIMRKIWYSFLSPLFRFKLTSEESRWLKANEKTLRKNIKRALSKNDYKSAADLYVSLNELKEAGKLFIKAGMPAKAAEIYERMGNLEKAAGLYKEANNFTKSAENFEKLRDFGNAAEMYEKGGFYKKAAEFYRRTSNHLKAAELYEQCFIEEGPRKSNKSKTDDYAYLSGTFYEKAGKFDKAISIYLRANYFKEAGLVYEKQGEFISAAEVYLEAGDLEMASASFQQGGDEKRQNEVLSRLSYQKGKLKEAADFAEKADDFVQSAEILAEANEFSEAGEQYLKAGWYSEAGEMFIKANAIQRAAEAFEKGENYVWAAQAYEKMGEKTERVPDLYEKGGEFFKAGVYYKELGLLDKALNVLQKIEETSEYYISASIMIGEIFMDKGMMKLAIERFQKIIDNKPVSQTVLLPYYYLALCYEESGKKDMAKAIYDKILAVDYQFKDVHDRASKITLKLKSDQVPEHIADADILKEGQTVLTKDSHQKRYVLLQEVGRGGMGIVYKAKDTILNRLVAYKILPSFLSANPSNFERFLREARISAKLNHRNIVLIFDTGSDEEDKFITMEFIEGKTLDRYLHGGRKFKLTEVINIAKQLCKALAYAHRNNVVHRDIKPSNIILSKDGFIKIMDFGIAKLLEDISKNMTSISGTPLYMSPEQIIGKNIDFQTDLYSFGVTVFELATGRPPFSEGDVYFHHLNTDPPSPKEINPSIPDKLCEIILKCLEKDKTKRYKKAEDILCDLTNISI